MKISSCRWIVTALAPVLACAALGGFSANAQQRDGGIASAARIYGYDLAAGNWTMEKVQCSVMPTVSLLHYHQAFPDGTESRFTAVVPLAGSSRVRIVPVLHRNATPFLPAPVNPRNYALFNELVKGSAAEGTWLNLSACFAALTGDGSGLHSELGIAGAPGPTVHVDPDGKTHRVTFATREGQTGYTVWSVSLDRFGRVTDASIASKSEYAANTKPAYKAHRESRELAADRESTIDAEGARNQKATSPTNAKPALAVGARENSPQQPSSDEAGWKFIPKAPDPSFKIIPNPPRPNEAVLPNP